MEKFDARIARGIVDSIYTGELEELLVNIKGMAEKGADTLHIYKKLRPATVEALKERGFKVTVQGGLAVQKDGLYYTINW